MTAPFTFDTGSVLNAVASLAEQAVAGTLTAEIKRTWAREHAKLFPFPPAWEVADNIARTAGYSKTVEKTILNVLGRDRVKAGLASQKDEATCL